MKTVVLDIESTGLPPKGWNYNNQYMLSPYILSIAWKINNHPRFEYIVNQEGRDVPAEATKINGITKAITEESKFNTFTVLLQFMMDADQSDHIIGHNIYFDTSIIKANVLRIIKVGGVTPIDMFNKMSDILHKDKRIDTMRICHKIFGGKWPTLLEAYQKLFNETFDNHSAGNDVDATYRIYEELVRRGGINMPVMSNAVVVEEE